MRRKIAIYVEGQTEQILVNHLIQSLWKFSGIHIQNIKLLADGNAPCKVPDFAMEMDLEMGISFLIIDVHGIGTLASAMGHRANRQHQEGFEIVGLRDLHPDNFPVQPIVESVRKALQLQGCKNPEKIDLFFAIMEVEAWLLAFTNALSQWTRISEQKLVEIIAHALKGAAGLGLEGIQHPSVLMQKLGELGNRLNAKSYDSVKSLVSFITHEEIEEVHNSGRVPSFSRFWSKFLGLLNEGLQETTVTE